MQFPKRCASALLRDLGVSCVLKLYEADASGLNRAHNALTALMADKNLPASLFGSAA